LPPWSKSVVDALRKPEWIAAVALLIQAIILIVQSKILGRHAETMEKHTEIASAQAETAKLIAQALDQQGKVLGEQTKIMDEQFKFQRRLEEKSERARVLDHLTEVDRALNTLRFLLSSVSTYTNEMHLKILESWAELSGQALLCTKELASSLYLSTDEQSYFLEYLRDVTSVPSSGVDFRKALANLDAIHNKHKDVVQKAVHAARTQL
jgi:hypothetical protein